MLIHGLADTREYKIWCGIKKRIFNVNCHAYKNYGGRGIKLHEEWINDPENFVNYIKSLPNYSQNLSIDRIDNNGNYVPGNLRWANDSEQSNNQRTRRDNKTKVKGICKQTDKDNYEFYVAYKQTNHKRKSKWFSISKYGEEEAFKLALEWRKEWEN